MRAPARHSLQMFRKYSNAYTPDYEPLRLAVERLPELGYDLDLKAAEGLIDGLGIVLHEYWTLQGIDIKRAPPRPSRSRSLPLAIEGPTGQVLDLLPLSSSTAASPSSPASSDDPRDMSRRDYQKYQRVRAVELTLANWDDSAIMNKLGISSITLKRYRRLANVPEAPVGRLPDRARKEITARFPR
jgi:hypothetical protein